MLVSPPGEAYSLRLGSKLPFRPEWPRDELMGGEFMPLRLVAVTEEGIGERGVLLLAIAGDRHGPCSEFPDAPPFAWLSLATELGVDDRFAVGADMFDALLMQEVPRGTLFAFEIIFGTKT